MPLFELKRLISHDDESLVAELRRVAALVGKAHLTARDFDQHSKVHSTCIRRHFGKWHECLARAGLDYRYSGRSLPKRISGRQYSNDQMIAELRRVSEIAGANSLTVELFHKHAEMGAETVRRRFGSWGAALKAAGILILKIKDDIPKTTILRICSQFGHTTDANLSIGKWMSPRRRLLPALMRPSGAPGGNPCWLSLNA